MKRTMMILLRTVTVCVHDRLRPRACGAGGEYSAYQCQCFRCLPYTGN